MTHSPLSVADAQQLRRAVARERLRDESGAVAAIRRAVRALAADNPERAMTTSEVLKHAAAEGAVYTPITLQQALVKEATLADGAVVRVQHGAYRLRVAGDTQAPVGLAVRDHVLAALSSMRAAGCGPVTFRELEEHVAGLGLRFSARALYHGLRQLLVDPSSGVVRVRPCRYQVRS